MQWKIVSKQILLAPWDVNCLTAFANAHTCTFKSAESEQATHNSFLISKMFNNYLGGSDCVCNIKICNATSILCFAWPDYEYELAAQYMCIGKRLLKDRVCRSVNFNKSSTTTLWNFRTPKLGTVLSGFAHYLTVTLTFA